MADTNEDVQQEGDGKAKRGFANMDPERVKEVAAQGGKEAQSRGKAHRFNSETGREAGRKGGKAAQRSGKAYRLTGDKARQAAKAGAAKRKAAKALAQEMARKSKS